MRAKGLAAWFGLLVVASFGSRACVRGDADARCRFDGVRIEPIHRVDRVRLSDGKAIASFCSIACALEWGERAPEASVPGFWQVRDEVSGRPLDARLAAFVLSRVVTVVARGERIHVFASETEAQDHAAEFGGARIADPFDARAPSGAAATPAAERR